MLEEEEGVAGGSSSRDGGDSRAIGEYILGEEEQQQQQEEEETREAARVEYLEGLLVRVRGALVACGVAMAEEGEPVPPPLEVGSLTALLHHRHSITLRRCAIAVAASLPHHHCWR